MLWKQSAEIQFETTKEQMMCRGDLSGNCRRQSTADVIKQLQQPQHVIRMMESGVAKHLLEGHFFSIWPQSWPRSWWRDNVVMVGMLCVCYQQQRKNMPLTERGVGQLFHSLQSQRRYQYVDGTRRLQMRWHCLKKVFITWEPSLKY